MNTGGRKVAIPGERRGAESRASRITVRAESSGCFDRYRWSSNGRHSGPRREPRAGAPEPKWPDGRTWPSAARWIESPNTHRRHRSHQITELHEELASPALDRCESWGRRARSSRRRAADRTAMRSAFAFYSRARLCKVAAHEAKDRIHAGIVARKHIPPVKRKASVCGSGAIR